MRTRRVRSILCRERLVPREVHEDVERVGLTQAGAVGQLGEVDRALSARPHIVASHSAAALDSQLAGGREQRPDSVCDVL